MRVKYILLVTACFFTMFGQAQNNAVDKTRLQRDYLKRSKVQKATGITLVSIGSAVFLVGCIGLLANTEMSGFLSEDNSSDKSPFGTFAIVGGSGVALSVGGITLINASRRNKKRSMQINGLTLNVSKSRDHLLGAINSENRLNVGIQICF